MLKKLEKLSENLWKNETLWKCLSTNHKNFGVCDYNYNLILPMIFDEIEMSPDKQIIGKINDKVYYFKTKFTDDKTETQSTCTFYADKKGQIIKEV